MLPANLNLENRLCVIIGGGSVALRRCRSLLATGAEVKIVAPDITDALQELPVTCMKCPYNRNALAGAFLAVIATGNPEVNRQVLHDCREMNILTNCCDCPEMGDITIPAHRRYGHITVAVSCGGKSASAAATIRDQITAHLDLDWIELLDIAAPFRRYLRNDHRTSERMKLAKKLTDHQAMHILKTGGRHALKEYYDKMCRQWLNQDD